jgi:hypothetical protein
MIVRPERYNVKLRRLVIAAPCRVAGRLILPAITLYRGPRDQAPLMRVSSLRVTIVAAL